MGGEIQRAIGAGTSQIRCWLGAEDPAIARVSPTNPSGHGHSHDLGVGGDAEECPSGVGPQACNILACGIDYFGRAVEPPTAPLDPHDGIGADVLHECRGVPVDGKHGQRGAVEGCVGQRCETPPTRAGPVVSTSTHHGAYPAMGRVSGFTVFQKRSSGTPTANMLPPRCTAECSHAPSAARKDLSLPEPPDARSHRPFALAELPRGLVTRLGPRRRQYLVIQGTSCRGEARRTLERCHPQRIRGRLIGSAESSLAERWNSPFFRYWARAGGMGTSC